MEEVMSDSTTDQVREHVHAMWAAVADRWAEYADETDDRGRHVTELMLDSVALAPGERVLELACGPGGTGLAAAERVGALGEVVLSDVAADMVAIAAARAAARGFTNVATRTLDLEAIEENDASFDVVLCREGLMFAVEPDRAAVEIHRVLRATGRVAVAVWGPPQENPWLGVVFEAVRSVTGMIVPPPGMPGPFALQDQSRLHDVLAGAGFVDIVIERVPTPVLAPSFEKWWARTSALAGPLSALLARLDAPTSDALQEKLRQAVAPYTSSSGLELPGLTLVARARRF
jgi:ubiquinone/menaquinone biosynthesis C-methylase UbiE